MWEKPYRISIILILLLNSVSYCYGQQIDNATNDSIINSKDCEQGDIKDLFKKKSKPEKTPKKRMLLILPNIASNPTNGFLFGVGGVYGRYFGSQKTTRVSTIGFTAAITTKQ